MNYHFIAIGGAVMHNLAIAIHYKGHKVTGSDDEIFDPAKHHLEQLGLLPAKTGWYPEKIHKKLDAVIVGMHARIDNPELLRASKLGLKVLSFPEFLYDQSRNKTRVVIGGSHGKTTITAMIMHVLRFHGYNFDYLVGSQVEGFDVMVKITDEAPMMIFEGDEYLAAPYDPRPKFHLYHPHIALISGIAWDHINVFPDFAGYVDQFRQFTSFIQHGGALVYNGEDALVAGIANDLQDDIRALPYGTPAYTIHDGISCLVRGGQFWPLKIFGKHNMQNLEGARAVCNQLGISDIQFYEAIKTFGGASRRLELLAANKQTKVFKDFAHSPSKLKATVDAVKEQFPEKRLVACMELHTFSSLSKSFLDQYKGCMEKADVAIVYFNPHTISLKKLPSIFPEEIRRSFATDALIVFSDSEQMIKNLIGRDWLNTNLLLMSSGNFNGTNLEALAMKIAP